MIRRLGLIYRKDKALSKAALGFIQVISEKAGQFDLAAAQSDTGAAHGAPAGVTASLPAAG
jgi:hypothetical protein